MVGQIKLRNRGQNELPRTHRETQCREVGIRQMRQHVRRDFIPGEAFGVFAEPKARKPPGDVHDTLRLGLRQVSTEPTRMTIRRHQCHEGVYSTLGISRGTIFRKGLDWVRFCRLKRPPKPATSAMMGRSGVCLISLVGQIIPA